MKKMIILLLLTSVCNVIFAQPEELFRGRHIVGGGNYGHPYTTIDRHNGDLSINQTIQKIRSKIVPEMNDSQVSLAYYDLYNFAVGPMPTDGGLNNNSSNPNGPSSLALWAKCNAFVFLIGLDSAGKWLDTTSYNGITSFARRNEFRDRVHHHNMSSNSINAFDHLTDEMPKFNEKTNIKFAARSLIYWLCAYDLLKAAYEIPELRDNERNNWGFGDADRNHSKSSPRNKLRKLTRDLYQLSTGWNGIIEHQEFRLVIIL